MRPYTFTFLVTLCGCGARVVDTPTEPDAENVDDTGSRFSPADSGGGGFISDAAPPGADAAAPVADAAGPVSEAAPAADSTPEPKPDAGDGPRITSLSACPSASGVDKLIAHTSEGIRFAASAVSVIPGGTSCPEVYPGTSSDGEYAFSAKCGTIDKTKPITVIVRTGVVGLSGKEMAPGTYAFVPTGAYGRLCGDDFRPAP